MSARSLGPVAVTFLGLALAGCNRGPAVVVVQPGAPGPNAGGPAIPATPVAYAPGLPPIPPPELTPQDRYDAALWTALTLIADHKLPEALAALETARTIQDTEPIRREIAQVKLRIDTRAAADRTASDIQTVLTDGKPDQAVRLAFAALGEYGGAEVSINLANLKRQADALLSVQLDPATRQAHFRQEADEAARANNLRAAVLAYEQVAAYGADPALRQRLDELHATLTRYDDNRRRAAELRRDPAQLEDAIAALREAAAAWDTPEIRQEIDDCTLALQCRRDRIGVADFETRGEVGLPQFGRTVAEELLPAFKSRFGLVERDQLGRVLDDLKLQSGDLIDHDGGRKELARLGRVRYLVVGSVTRLGGVSVHARLLDLNTGLVVQTGKVTAPTAEAVVPLLPQLAAMLQMSDDQRLAYEQQLAQQAAAPPVAPEVVTIPPPPEVLAPQAALPPPIIVATPRPPDFGGVLIADFQQLPQFGVTVQLELTKNHKVRARGLSVALELGDNLFRRGQYREAQAQYQVALNLSPGHADVLARLDRCQPYLPPAPPVTVPVVVRPRVAVLDFASVGDPALVPPGTGGWAAEQIAPYLCPPYDVADRGEVYWYAGRLGLTVRDLVVDPLARLYLGRSLNARFVVLGTVQATPAGLAVAAHLLDTETGARLATAECTARDRAELKYRLGELARWLVLDPAERTRQQAEAAQAEALVIEAQQAARQSNFTLALELTKKAGQKRPGIHIEVLFQQYDRQAQAAALEAQRRAEWERQQALAAEAARRQQQLVAAAEAARVAAAQQAAALTESERRRLREVASAQLLAQARAARDSGNFVLSVQLFDSSLGVERRDDVAREQALVRARAEEQAHARVAADATARALALQRQREAELARVQVQLNTERQQLAVAQQAHRQAQDATDAREYARLLDESKQLMAKGQTDGAVRSLQAAKRLRPTGEADGLLTQALIVQARATAQSQGEQARKDLEAKLATERAAREKAEAAAKQSQAMYAQALQQAQAALQARQYDQAVARYQEAGKFYKTDVVLTGLKAAQDAQAADRAHAEAERKRGDEAQQKAAAAKLQADADARRIADAKAKGNADAKAKADARLRAEADARARADAEAKLRADTEAKAKAMTDAKARADAEAQRQAEAAAKIRADADARLRTAAEARQRADADAKARADAEAKADAAAKAKADADARAKAQPPAPPAPAPKAMIPPPAPPAFKAATPPPPVSKAPAPPPPPSAYAQQMQLGMAHERQEQFADALTAYQAALHVQPNDPTATKRAEYAHQMAAGIADLKANKRDDAARAFEAALKVAPNDPVANKWLQQARR